MRVPAALVPQAALANIRNHLKPLLRLKVHPALLQINVTQCRNIRRVTAVRCSFAIPLSPSLSSLPARCHALIYALGRCSDYAGSVASIVLAYLECMTKGPAASHTIEKPFHIDKKPGAPAVLFTASAVLLIYLPLSMSISMSIKEQYRKMGCSPSPVTSRSHAHFCPAGHGSPPTTPSRRTRPSPPSLNANLTPTPFALGIEVTP